MRIDAHQHFWTIARGDYGWLTPELGILYKDFGPNDLGPHLSENKIDGTVLVQAAPTVAETEFMLSLADRTSFIKGVVGWVDFEDPDAPRTIAKLAQHEAFAGLRPMIQDIEEDDWMLGENLRPAFEALIAQGLTFDALTLPKHLSNLATLLSRHPDMHVVIDHTSKPLIRDNLMTGWAEDMAALAANTNAYCKLSGMVTEANPNWTVADLRPYVEHLLEHFGPDRLIWGSDWPVCLLAASYDKWVETTDALLADLSSTERDAIMGGNAQRAYKLRV